MSQPEIVPQSMVDARAIILKPRLDQGDVQLIGEKIKRRLFSKFGLRPRLENIRLLSCEIYYEPYLIIGGKYSLDYCRRHLFKVNVDEKTTKVLVGGQEFTSEQRIPNGKDRVIKVNGEEHAHQERQTYFVLDRMKREIQPEKLPISPFGIQGQDLGVRSDFRSIQISDEEQVEFLKAKIAKRPACAAEIIREIFEITERTIVYYPMYQSTFENVKNQKDATITINGITGEIVLNATRKLATKTILTFPKSFDIHLAGLSDPETQTQLVPRLTSPDRTRDRKSTLTGRERKQPTALIAEETITSKSAVKSSDKTGVRPNKRGHTTTIVGDVEVPPGTIINKDLIVDGSLVVGDDCKIRGGLDALKDVTVGANTVIEGDLISGANVIVGPHSLIAGSLRAAGTIKISENTKVEGGLCSNPACASRSKIQLEVVQVEELR